jgi:hypothetical protein
VSQEKLQNVIGKIHKLRALSEGTHSRGEKEAAAAAIAKLIAEFQLTEAEIQSHANALKRSDDPIDLESEHIIYESGRMTPWKVELAIGIAKLQGLFIYNAWARHPTKHRKINRYRIIGRQSDIQLGLYMMDYLSGEIKRLADDQFRFWGCHRGINPERESYCMGAVRGFLAKMKVERDKALQAATSTALVWIGNKAQEAKTAWSKSPGATQLVPGYQSKANTRAEHFNQGWRDGQKISVNPGVSGGNQAPAKLGE